jgi:putative endonuclease
MTNKCHTVLYTGVTNDLERRVVEHSVKMNPKSFTARYNVNKLVWYEAYWDIRDAIAREKQIKGGPRWRKLKLIEHFNPEWLDLTSTIK